MQYQFNPESFTIAVHARRGDIVNSNNAASRWTPDDVYSTILEALLRVAQQQLKAITSPVAVHIFSEGTEVRSASKT